jgi:hypothetical protein
MTDEPETDLQNLWQEQPAQSPIIDLKALHRRAEKFQSRLFWRNTREYIAAAFIGAAFCYEVIVRKDIYMRGGFLLSLLGVAFYAFILHTRGRADREGLPAAGEDCFNFHRKALAHQRDLLRAVWLWGILPLVPGFVALLGRQAVLHPENIQKILMAIGWIFLLFSGVIWLNVWAAGRMQKRIDELDGVDRRIEMGKPGKWNALFFRPSQKAGQVPFRKLDPIKPPTVFNMKMAVIVFVLVAGLLVLVLVPLMAGVRR